MEGRFQKRQKRTGLKLSEQTEATTLLRSGTNAVSVKNPLGASRRTVTNIKTKCKKIIYQADVKSMSLNLRTTCTTLFPKIDIDVMRFMILSKNMGYSITQSVLQHRVLFIQEGLRKHLKLNHDDKGKLETFCASKKWVLKFIFLYRLRSAYLHGEA